MTLADYGRICRIFPEGERWDKKLSYSHHRAVATLPPEQRNKWLSYATVSGIGVNELRSEIKAYYEKEELMGEAGTDRQYKSLSIPIGLYERLEEEAAADGKSAEFLLKEILCDWFKV